MSGFPAALRAFPASYLAYVHHSRGQSLGTFHMSLTTLPYDILFIIIGLLDIEEQVNLGKTNRVLHYLYGDESLSQSSAEVRHSVV